MATAARRSRLGRLGHLHSHDLFLPLAEPDDPIDWPAHLRRVDLDIHWTGGPDPSGSLLLEFINNQFVSTALLGPGDGIEAAAYEFTKIETFPGETSGVRASVNFG